MNWFGRKSGRDASRPALARGLGATWGEWPPSYEAQVREGYLANAIVQRAAMETWTGLGKPGARSFRQVLDADPAVAARVAPAELDRAMSADMHLAHVDHVFARVFGRQDSAMAAA